MAQRHHSPANDQRWRDELAGSSIFHRYVGSTPAPDAVRVLAIDGGGIRGILPALVAAELEERSGHPIVELFDVIVGTSTGSILALGLVAPGPDGRPTWAARDAVKLYAERGDEVFSRAVFSAGMFHEKYRHEDFERLLAEVWGSTLLSQAITHCMATAYDLSHRSVLEFDSEEAKRDPAEDYEMKTVVRAATAAPTFFDPARAVSRGAEEAHLLIDGAIYANNPSMVAFTEVQRMGPTDVILVSLGTGDEVDTMHWELVKEWGLTQWARPILDLLFSSASQAVDYQLRHLLGPERYHRFQAPLVNCNHRLDDASATNVARLQEVAEQMITTQSAEIDHLAQLLVRQDQTP